MTFLACFWRLILSYIFPSFTFIIFCRSLYFLNFLLREAVHGMAIQQASHPKCYPKIFVLTFTKTFDFFNLLPTLFPFKFALMSLFREDAPGVDWMAGWRFYELDEALFKTWLLLLYYLPSGYVFNHLSLMNDHRYDEALALGRVPIACLFLSKKTSFAAYIPEVHFLIVYDTEEVPE